MSRAPRSVVNPLTLMPVLVATAVLLTPSQSARAAYTLDRWFQMGDDLLFSGGGSAENASDGAAVGSGSTLTGLSGAPVTYDSAATNNDNFQPLAAFGTDGLPTSAEYGVGGNPAAPVAAAASMNSFAVRFDGVDDYLAGINLNNPSISAPGSLVTYPDTTSRGMQLWVYPENPDGVIEHIVDDGDEHGFRISATGQFQTKIREARTNSGVTATPNTWTHLMNVRDGANNRNVGYVNGVVVSVETPGYDFDNGTNLLVGANAEDNVGETADPSTLETPGFFQGLVDEIELFVIDDGTTYGAFDYVQDNGYFTDVYLPSTSGYGFTLDAATGHNSETWVQGDINFDGGFDSADVDAFVAGWLSSLDNLPGAGPQVGDYVTLGLGDLDLDGDTDLGDWILLRDLSAGASLALPPLEALIAGVPEPSSCLAALTGVLACLGAQRRS